jgi:hypothetical protein
MVVELEQIIALPVWEGVAITLILLSAILVAIRVWTNTTQLRNPGFDDGISILAVLFSTSTFAVNDVIIRAENDPSKSAYWQVKMGVVIVTLVQFALWTAKAPILLLYAKIFGIHKWLRYSSYAVLVAMALAYLGALINALVNCPLNNPNVTFEAQLRCNAGNVHTGIISGFTSIFVDAIIFVLPIPVIVKLNIATGKKIAIAAVFLSGIFGIVASIVSQYYKWLSWKGHTTDFTVTILALQIECGVVIMVGCAPALKAFWTLNFAKRMSSSTPSYKYSLSSLRSPKNSRMRRLWSQGSDRDVSRELTSAGSYTMTDTPQRDAQVV